MCARGRRSRLDTMIRAHQLTKRFGDRTAVDGVDFVVEPGRVTGFLGPNGAGKSTTMRMILGLDAPTSGTVSVNGHRYAASPAPLREIGALLDAHAIHPGRSARDHLRWMAASNGIPTTRVGEVLDLVGLESVAGQRAGRFSLGMGQRLGIAAAMLGDPATLILDEPVNGLDPEGVLWVRQFVRHLASEGRTVFLSSHLMSEMAVTADHLIVLGRGEIIADAPVADIIAGGTRPRVRVRSPHASQLADLLAAPEVAVVRSEAGVLEITGVEASGIGDLAAAHALAIHELTPKSASLEEAYMALTADAVEYRTEAVR
jgi:ABC-2 type transport system ATP-binding protein